MAGTMRALAVALAVLLSVSGLGRAHASGQSGSGSGSGGDSQSSKDSNSSNGSKDSSNTSEGTSDNSHASSKDSSGSSKESDASTQNSPKNSSEWSTKHSSDWSTKTREGHIFTVALLVVSVGATVVGVLVAKSGKSNDQQRAAALAETMRRHHPLLTHDIATASGVALDAWGHDLRLTAAERRRLARSLEGSVEQGELLEALDGKIDEARARKFGAAFLRVAERALGAARTKVIVARAVRETSG
jgi:hypothetical protein